MIDLEQTRQKMLGDIGVSEDQAVEILRDPMAPACIDGDPVRLTVDGHSRDDLFPWLKILLAARYAHVPPARLTRDLLAPLKNGLGNAYKRGNAKDRAKTIRVEIDATRRGAVISITDEGAGFDVAQTLESFHAQEHYFHNIGAGFRAFARTASLVSYANGGRTFLLRFLADVPDSRGMTMRTPGFDSTRADRWREALSNAPDFTAYARRELGMVDPPHHSAAPGTQEAHEARLAIETMCIHGPTVHDRTLRCFSRLGSGALITSGFPFPTAQAARADYETARALHASMHAKKVRIPEAVACIETDAVVVYAFDPWMDLWTYIAERDNSPSIARLMQHLGVCLAMLHGVRAVSLPTESWDGVCDTWRVAVERAGRFLVATEPGLETRVAAFGASLLRRARALAPGPVALVHASFGLHRVHYGVDGRFYLTGFDSCRFSHPGRDLGALFADLALLTNTSYSSSRRDNAVAPKPFLQDLVLTAYAGNAPLGWEQDLHLFVAGAMIERIASGESTGDSAASSAWTTSRLSAALALAEQALHELDAID